VPAIDKHALEWGRLTTRGIARQKPFHGQEYGDEQREFAGKPKQAAGCRTESG